MKIIYKIVNTIATLAVIPVLLFLPMFRFIMVVDVSSGNQILSLLGGMLDINQIITKAIGVDLENLPEFYTLKSAYGMFFGENAQFANAGLDASALPAEMIHWFTAAGVLFVLALVCAVVVLILGFFIKKKLIPAGISALGFAFAFAAGKCFSHIADQLVSGRISLSSILANMEALADYKSYLGYIDFDIRIFELSSAFTMLLIVFGALVLLNIGFHLADSVSDK